VSITKFVGNTRRSCVFWSCLILALICLAGVAASLLWGLPPPFSGKPFVYSSSTVSTICKLFKLKIDDPFCTNTQSQNPDTLTAMFNRDFPPGKTMYDDMMPFIKDLFSAPPYQRRDDRKRDFTSPGYCPKPSECTNNYYCFVDVPGVTGKVEINFSILFDNNTGYVTQYRVTRPSGS
jgi:hypothetical protein